MSTIVQKFRFLLAASFLCLYSLVWAEESKEEKTYRFGTLTDNYPYSFLDDNGEPAGFAVDLSKAIARSMGFRYVQVLGTTPSNNEHWLDHGVDVVQTLARSPAREVYLDFSVPYLTMWNAIFVRKGTKDIHDLKDLRGHRVMVHKGSLGEALLKQHGLENEIAPALSVEKSILLLAQGENDALIGTRLTVMANAARFGIKNIEAAGPPIVSSPIDYCYAVRDNNKELLATLNEGLAILHQTGEFNQIYMKWFGNIDRRGYSALQITLAVSISLAVALLVAIIAMLRQRHFKQVLLQQAEALRASEERYRGVFESSNEGLLVLEPAQAPDENLLITQANEAAVHLLRLTAPFAGRPLAGASPTAALLQARIAASLAEQGPWLFEQDLSTDGASRWARVSIAKLQGRLLLVLADITDARVAEERLRRNEQQLIQTQKLEAIGTLASGIAHDFNNILTGILGNAELARMETASEHPSSQFLDELLRSSGRAKDLVRQILTFSRKTEARREPMDAAPLVKEVAKFMRAATPTSIDIQTLIPDALPRIDADPTQVHQVLMNLCTNAVHALKDTHGLLEISLEEINIGPEIISVHPQLRPGHFLRISVRDTGCGMGPDVLRHIFEPFFTTKPSGEGTGLGLSVVHGIMQGHGGALTVYSQPGQGSVFHLYFPASDASEKPGSTAQETTLHRGNGEQILIVDDEAAIVRTLSALLTRLGYRPVPSNFPEEALKLFTSCPEDYACVITDLTMPRMNGLELTERIRALRPGLPVIMTSGFVGEKEQARATALGISRILNKPLSFVSLATTLRDCLNTPASSEAQPPKGR